ncbi:hypothetical protein CL657_00905 [bacterium]|nr:hypothetical protein [bacterium]
MTTESNKLEEESLKKGQNIPIKIKGVLKDQFAIEEKRIKLNPIKKFKVIEAVQPLPLESPQEFSEELDLEIDKEDGDDSEYSEKIDQNDTQDNSKGVEDTYALMKRNINEEMKLYKKQQIESIQKELRTLKETAHQEGYQEGYQEGRSIFKESSDSFLEALKDLNANKKEDLLKKRDFTISLALLIAEKIMAKQIQENNDVFNNLFLEALDKVTEKDSICITINPEDKPLLTSLMHQLEDKFKSFNNLEINTDRDVKRGGCTIDTNLGYIDATVSSKLTSLKKAIDEFHEKEDLILNKESLEGNPATAAVANNKYEDQSIMSHTQEITDIDSNASEQPRPDSQSNDLHEEQEKDMGVSESLENPKLENNEDNDSYPHDNNTNDDDDDDDGYDLFEGLDLSDFEDSFNDFQ